MQRNQTVLIAPSVVVTFLDDAAVVGQGQLGLCVILPVAVAHHPVACPNPESEDTTLPQTDPEWTVCLGVIQPLYNSVLIFDVLNPQQACVFGLAVVKGLFPSRFSFNDFDSHMTWNERRERTVRFTSSPATFLSNTPWITVSLFTLRWTGNMHKLSQSLLAKPCSFRMWLAFTNIQKPERGMILWRWYTDHDPSQIYQSFGRQLHQTNKDQIILTAKRSYYYKSLCRPHTNHILTCCFW